MSTLKLNSVFGVWALYTGMGFNNSIKTHFLISDVRPGLDDCAWISKAPLIKGRIRDDKKVRLLFYRFHTGM